MNTLQVGQSYHFTVAGSDGSTIPAGTMTAISNEPSTVSVVVNPDNSGTVTGIAPTPNVTITYSAPGYTNATEGVQVVPRPSIVVTDGPITG